MPAIVAIERCGSYRLETVQESLRTLVSHMEGIGAYVKPGNRVLLKPNMLSGDRPERCVCTHPALIEAVILLCREVGAEPVIGDSPALGTAKRTAKGNGILEVCRRHDVSIVDLGKSLRGKAEPLFGASRPQITNGLAEFDAILNLPKVKVHQQIYLTLAVKNLYGCVPGRRKALWHFLLRRSVDEFARMIVANMTAIRPTLSITDGIIAMERTGPRGGDPAPVGLLVAGADPVAVDRVWIELLGARMDDYPILRAAREMGIGETDLSAIEIRGTPLSDAQARDFRLLEEMGPIGFSLPHIVRGIWKQLQGKTLPTRDKVG
ncbi:MAG TPA: DUF362 domain-containing protein [bacterium]|nr:DUF362 domain-containing protein [bacterium]